VIKDNKHESLTDEELLLWLVNGSCTFERSMGSYLLTLIRYPFEVTTQSEDSRVIPLSLGRSVFGKVSKFDGCPKPSQIKMSPTRLQRCSAAICGMDRSHSYI
jgi:hypothetical protein